MRQIEVESIVAELKDVKMFTVYASGTKIVYRNKDIWEAEVLQFGGRRGYISCEKYVPSLEEVRGNFKKCSSYMLHGKEDVFILED